jgi:hypothetical protein
MAHTMRWLPVAGCLVLVACGGGQAARDEAAIAASCKADRSTTDAVCDCTAAKLRAALEPETLTSVAEFLTSLDEASNEQAQGVIAMSAMSNTKLLAAMDKLTQFNKECAAEGKAGAVPAAQDEGPSRKLAGTYVPQLGDVDAGSRNLAAAAADRRWEFSEDGTVVTHSQRGPVKWSYEVRGNEIRLRGADAKSSGESRRFTYTQDGRCIWDGSGRSSVDMRFCPQ